MTMTWPWASPHTVRVWTIDWKPAVSPRGVCKENFAAGKTADKLAGGGTDLVPEGPSLALAGQHMLAGQNSTTAHAPAPLILNSSLCCTSKSTAKLAGSAVASQRQ